MYRNKKLLDHAVDCPFCMGCGKTNDETLCAAHSNQLRDGKGRGIKAHDFRIAYLCYECHTALDQGKDMSKEERTAFWEEAHRNTIAYLFMSNKLKVC